MNRLQFLLIMPALLLTSCELPFGGSLIKPVADVAKVAIVANSAKKTITTISDNITKRDIKEKEVIQAEINKDDKVNIALESAISKLPQQDQIPLIKQALTLRGKDIQADVDKAVNTKDLGVTTGRLQALLFVLFLLSLKFIADKVFPTPVKTTKEF